VNWAENGRSRLRMYRATSLASVSCPSTVGRSLRARKTHFVSASNGSHHSGGRVRKTVLQIVSEDDARGRGENPNADRIEINTYVMMGKAVMRARSSRSRADLPQTGGRDDRGRPASCLSPGDTRRHPRGDLLIGR
jgi:hypothetical protein